MSEPKIDWESVDRFFPSPGALGGLVPASAGLSVRDAVALVALYGLVVGRVGVKVDRMAEDAWNVADVWMAEREKRCNEARP